MIRLAGLAAKRFSSVALNLPISLDDRSLGYLYSRVHTRSHTITCLDKRIRFEYTQNYVSGLLVYV